MDGIGLMNNPDADLTTQDTRDCTMHLAETKAKIIQMSAGLNYTSTFLVVYSFLYLFLRTLDIMGMEERYSDLQNSKSNIDNKDEPYAREKFHLLYYEVNYYTFVLAILIALAMCYLKYSLYKSKIFN